MKVKFKVDTTNEKGALAKGHGIVIKAGEVITIYPVTDRIKKLINLGIAEYVSETKEDVQEQKDVAEVKAEGEKSGGSGEKAAADPVDEITRLKKTADDLGITYAPNIGADTLKERIQKQLDGTAAEK